MRMLIVPLVIGLTGLAGCQIYPPTPKPDYTIRVMPSPGGMVALPPTCPSWVSDVTDPYDNQPLPQFGCASQRNLALMVEKPEDLVGGRDMGPASGVTTVGSMARYYNNQTRGLIWTGTDPNTVATTTSSTATSAISGEVPSASSSSSSSSAPTSTSTASAPSPSSP